MDTELYVVTMLGKNQSDRLVFVVEAENDPSAHSIVKDVAGFGVISCTKLEREGRNRLVYSTFVSNVREYSPRLRED